MSGFRRSITPTSSAFRSEEVISKEQSKAVSLPQQDSGNANPQIPESNHCLPPLVEVSNEQSSAGNDAVSTSTASSRLNPFEESPEPAKRVENLNPFSTPNLGQTGLAPSEASFDPDGQSDGDDISFDPDVTNTSPAQLMSRFATKMGAKLKNDAADKRAAELEAAKATHDGSGSAAAGGEEKKVCCIFNYREADENWSEIAHLAPSATLGEICQRLSCDLIVGCRQPCVSARVHVCVCARHGSLTLV